MSKASNLLWRTRETQARGPRSRTDACQYDADFRSANLRHLCRLSAPVIRAKFMHRTPRGEFAFERECEGEFFTSQLTKYP